MKDYLKSREIPIPWFCERMDISENDVRAFFSGNLVYKKHRCTPATASELFHRFMTWTQYSEGYCNRMAIESAKRRAAAKFYMRKNGKDFR